MGYAIQQGELKMQSGAHRQGYSTGGSHVPKLRRSRKGQQDGSSNERNQGAALLMEIHEDQKRLSPKMLNLADFCLKNIHALHRMRILELAHQTGNIPSTV